MGKRDDAMRLLDKHLPAGIEIQSKRDEEKYTELTGITHEKLKANWKDKSKIPTGGIMSGCNGFASWYAGNLGVTGIANWFKLQDQMRGIGKDYAWVTADGRSDPAPGDILHHSKSGTGLHVDVCVGFTSDRKLIRAAAGQISFMSPRNPEKEFDVIKRVTGQTTYSYSNLLGWLDIEQYFWAKPAPSAEPLGNWAVGWWKVNDGNQYYYHFDTSRRVQYTTKPPATQFAPPKVPLNSGKFDYEPGRRIVIEWNPADGGQTIEIFSASIDLAEMNGTSNRYGPLYASRYSAK